VGVSFRQLRETCQAPVRHHNDVAGLLFGDRASLPLTKLFVDLRLSPSIATVAFLVCGLLGSALQLVGPAWAVAGAALLVLYYILDCVDGEVARWQGVEDMRWGYFDYIFHMVVKPSCFLAVAVGTWLELENAWLLLAGAVAAVAVLWLKLFLEIPGILFLRGVLAGAPGGSRAFRRFLGSLRVGGVEAAPSGGEAPPVMRLGFDLTTVRALLTNFDVGLLLLLVAALVDVFVEPFVPWSGWPPLTARAVWLVFYSVNLPLNFLDYVLTYVRRGHFASETERLLVLAHHYRLDPARSAEAEVADEPPRAGGRAPR
jgi:phosphatidylglycerophosphate synthase